MADFTYRDVIYKNYKDDLEDRTMFKNIQKERKMIKKYMKRNYMRFIPKDKDVRIIDLGCGLGHYIWALKDMGYTNVCGVDASESNVKFCTEHGLNVELGDITTFLEKKADIYDVIIFNDVIEHFTKPEIIKLLPMLKAALKRGGGGV